MPLSRRSTILAAGGAGLALVGAFGAYRVTRQPATALSPWQIDAAAPADVRLDALRHAILAPNPHNRQPWLLRLDGADTVTVLCDLDRRLPQTDPYDRQITIGFGCFLELARIAAAERGYRVETVLFPDGEPQPRLDGTPIARLRFVADPGIAKDPLFPAITVRRSTKEPYDMTRAVDAAVLNRLGEWASGHVMVDGTADPARVAELRQLVLTAGDIEAGLPRTHLESVRLIRIGHDEIDANPDGIDLGGPLMEGLKLMGQISREQIGDPTSQAYKTGVEIYREVYGSAPAYVWLTTAGNTRADQIAVGVAYVRVNLMATQLGLAMHPASQSLQEYPEMAGPFERAQQLLGGSGAERVQLLARIGYGPAVPPSPRWPLESRIVAA